MEKETHVVAVDSGKFTTKAVLVENGEVVKDFFIETKMRETEELQAKDSKTHVLTMNGVSTVLGSESEIPDTLRTKKRDIHRRATYLSLAKLVPNGGSVLLSIGCPLSMYMKQDVMDDYEKFMLNLEEEDEIKLPCTLTFDVDGVNYQYIIEELVSSPETSGHIFKRADDYEGESIAVVDIGGLNVNGAIYSPVDLNDASKGIDIADGTHLTLDLGTHYFSQTLSERLNDELNISLRSQDMRLLLRKGYIQKKSLREDSARIIREEKEKYVNKILTGLRLEGWSLETMDFVFVGGGSLLLKDQILEEPLFEDAEIPERAQWENVEGFALAAASLLHE